MGTLLWLAQYFLPVFAHGLAQAAILAAQIAGALLAYGLLLGLLGVTSWPGAVRAVRQARSRDLRA
jgi:hypothetical protein